MSRKAAVTKQENDELLKLDNQLCFALYATSRAVTSLYRPVLKEMGLTYPQYLVMLVLWERKNANVGELGEHLYLDSGTLTPLLKRLEKAGLIIRSRDDDDERQVNISLTLAGARLKRRATSVVMSLACKLQMPEQKVLSLRSELNQLLKVAASEAE